MLRILYFTLIFSISIFLIEGFLKFVEIATSTFNGYDQQFGTKPQPNMKYLKFKEGFFMGETNRFGRVGDTYGKEKKSGKIRIALLGDSYVQGIDVLPRNHFRSVMEKELNNEEQKYEVLCFGRGNFALPMSYYYYSNHASHFNLDYVLYFLEFRDFSAKPFQSHATYYEVKNDVLVENRDWEKRASGKIMKFFADKPLLGLSQKLSLTSLAYRGIYNNMLQEPQYDILFGKFWSPKTLFFPKLKLDLGQGKGLEFWGGEVDTRAEISESSKFILDKLINDTTTKVIFVLRHYPVRISIMENYMISIGADFITLNELFDGPYIRESKINANYFKATQLYGGHYNNQGHKALGKFLAEKFRARIDLISSEFN